MNRYTDVVPCKYKAYNYRTTLSNVIDCLDDETLVRLDSTRTGIYYINASHVEDVAADRKYILTQVSCP